MDADVVVIGAGAAGLAAARTLAANGLRTIVLEARDRIGGRVLSVPMSRRILPAELGAEFIHGSAPQTMALLREAGLAAVESGDESWSFEGGALRRDDGEFQTAADIFEQSRSLAQDESVERYLQRFSADEAIRTSADAARAFVEGFDAADPSLASVQGIADELRSGVDSRAARPIGGYPPVFEHVREAAAAAGARLHLNTMVRRLTWRPGAVTIAARGFAGEPLTVSARAVIVTLPVGVLRDTAGEAAVRFEPPLPAAKTAALRSIEMGHVVKVVLSFQSAFWTAIGGGRYRTAAFFRNPSGSFPAYWTQFPVHGELIAAWAGGPAAAALSDRPDDDLVQLARSEFGAMLGEPEITQRAFERGCVHNWRNDPLARGAYSYLAVGAGDARGTLASPVDGTLFFAGEATAGDGQGGTVSGAFQTGERAAQEVLHVLSADVPAGRAAHD